ncbi:hypothetical protein CPB85DRAFT_1483488 [Mucidula mucida]|nr:hypothetical protein CPB85DRAFT_1483488 [Mucidula mucida]
MTGILYIEVDVQTSDGVVLKCYLLRQAKLPTARATIILFHGNNYHSWSNTFTTYGYNLWELGSSALTVSYRERVPYVWVGARLHLIIARQTL